MKRFIVFVTLLVALATSVFAANVVLYQGMGNPAQFIVNGFKLPDETLFQSYAGTPEAHVTAERGSLCINSTYGALYVKLTGSGNTGWSSLGTAASVTAALAYTDAKLLTAEAYSDTMDAFTLATSEAYSDTMDAFTLATSEAYTDLMDAFTLATSEVYADGIGTTAGLYTDAKLITAEVYADLMDAYTLATAEAYTDSIVVGTTEVDFLTTVSTNERYHWVFTDGLIKSVSYEVF